ncbi:MAG: hypothetical protein WBD37_06250 [Anderseniella sp.]
MSVLIQLVRIMMVAAVALSVGVTSSMAASTDGTVYDPQILKRIKFTSEQLPKVKQILNKSEEGIIRVFGKYRIDPRAKPNFDRLRAASNELQAIESWEKGQMKRLLTKDQFADYLEIQQATTAAVIKATRDD